MVFLPNQISHGCGGWSEPDASQVYYSFFNERLLLNSDSEYYQLNFGGTLSSEFQVDRNKDETNLSQWESYFGEEVTQSYIRGMLYSSNLDQLQQFYSFIRKNKEGTENPYEGNDLAAWFEANPNDEALDYFVFAKRTEPHATWSPYYWDDNERDTMAITNLIEEARQLFNTAKKPFIKQRYAYQVVRLNHYISKSEDVIQAYNELIEPIGMDNLIRYWALSCKVGALQKLGKKVESIRDFATVFDKCPSRRRDIMLSVDFENQETFRRALDLCTAPGQKAAIWLILALEPHSHALESMQEIYTLNPNSVVLDYLLSREIEKIEDLFLPERFPKRGSFDNWPDTHYDYFESLSEEMKMQYLHETSTFVKKVASSRKISTPAFWLFSAGYLCYLEKDYANMSKLLSMCQKESTNNKKLVDQATLIQLACKYDTLTSIDSEKESEILKDFEVINNLTNNSQKQDVKNYIIHKMGMLYYQKNQERDMTLCSMALYEWIMHREEDVQASFNVYEEFAWFRDSAKTEMQEYLLQYYPLTIGGFHEVIGTEYLSMLEFEKARDEFRKSEDYGMGSMSWNYTLRADPFSYRISDCHDCDFEDRDQTECNKLEFVERMLELDSLAQTDIANQSQCYFEMGNGFYNMSHYGNSWMITGGWRNNELHDDFYRFRYREGDTFEYTYPSYTDTVNFEMYEKIVPLAQINEDKDDYERYDFNDRALQYYVNALQKSTDKEMAAKCCFMAAKCEQNIYYQYVESHDPDELLHFRTFFKKLEDDYKETEYYKEVINECKYFRWFVDE